MYALRARFAPRVRLVASGGAWLDSALAWTLEGLGWTVATGYDLPSSKSSRAWRSKRWMQVRYERDTRASDYGEIAKVRKGTNANDEGVRNWFAAMVATATIVHSGTRAGAEERKQGKKTAPPRS